MHRYPSPARLFWVAVGLLVSAPALRAAEAEWKVGLAQVKITPEKAVFLSGYSNRKTPFTGVEADLYVKALILVDRDGRRAALVTSDLLGFPAAIAEPICQRIQKKT